MPEGGGQKVGLVMQPDQKHVRTPLLKFHTLHFYVKKLSPEQSCFIYDILLYHGNRIFN